MAAEAFIADPGLLEGALIEGNYHTSKFTTVQAENFIKHWRVLDQKLNTSTGFSGTLFECIADDPVTGAKVGERVLSFRSTEFIDDAARDNQALIPW